MLGIGKRIILMDMKKNNIFDKYIDKDYKEFQDKLIPNSNILGIRMPKLKEIAKELVKNNDLSLLDSDLYYHEEKITYMLMLSNIKDINIVHDKLDLMVPKIDNWAVCDSLMNIKIIRKNRDYFYDLIEKYRYSKKEFEVRFVLIMLFSHYMDESYLDTIFDVIESVNTDNYYSKMGLAWLLCECFIKYRDYTLKRFKDLKIDNFSFNKAIDKIRDSYRVSDIDKSYLKSLKR